jgi:squalene-hopene/tetraprenyl-beta-curcumene cyclase
MVAVLGLGLVATTQAQNHVSVTFGTWYYYTTLFETSVANVPLSTDMLRPGFFGHNSIDLTGAPIISPVYTFLAAKPAIAGGTLLAPGETFTWTPPDTPEGVTVWAHANRVRPLEPGETTFLPGFRAEYTLTPEQVDAPGGRQTVTLKVTIEEPGLRSLELEIAVAADTPHSTATISPFLAPASPTVSPERDRLSWSFAEPAAGRTFTFSAIVNVQVKEGIPHVRYMPTIMIWVSKDRARGTTVGDYVTCALPEGTWTWSATGTYTWDWVNQIRRAVTFQGLAAPGFAPPTQAAINSAVDRGLDWLARNQKPDGSWDYSTSPNNVGMTALSAWAFLQAGYSEHVATVRSALDFVLSHHREDGSFRGNTYETSLGIIALVATGNAAYRDVIDQAADWLIEAQNREDKDYAAHGYPGLSCSDGQSCWAYGGWGYGISGVQVEEERGTYIWSDNSNSQFAIAALAAAGVPADHPVWTRALDWVSRCQNLDGGFEYQAPGTGSSYGSMTGAGLWELGVMGVPRDDPRVQAGLDWLTRNYAYHENPRWGDRYHHYYLWSAARALLHHGFPGTVIPQPGLAGWYYDFAGYLVEYQQKDGSWTGTSRRDDGALYEPPEYATPLAILVLSKAALPTQVGR